MTQPFASGGYVPGPAPTLPPEPEQIQRLRHTLARYDEEAGFDLVCHPDSVTEAVIEAARDVLHTIDAERQRYAVMTQTHITAEALGQISKPILDRMRDTLADRAERNAMVQDKNA